MTLRRTAALGAAAVMLGTLITIAAPVNAQTAPTCNGEPATIVGTDGNDRIEGTDGDDVIVGLAGKDIIFGRSGNDTICGGPGNDVIKGGRGNDYVEGNQGNDKLIGGIGRDTMDGGNHKDKLFGGGGPDTLIGSAKRDFVNGQGGNDTCDLDPHDRWQDCEAGDVIVYSGTGSATVELDVPMSFSLHQSPTRGIVPQPFFYYFATEFDVQSGQASVEILRVGDDVPFRPDFDNHESHPPSAEILGFHRPITAIVVARDHAPDSEWTLTFPGPDAIPYVPRTFSANGQWSIIGQFEVPTQAGQTFDWNLDAAGNPYFKTFGASGSIWPVDERFTTPGPVRFTGEMPAGTVFANWVFFPGDYTFSIG